MSVKRIKKALEHALIKGGEMQYGLYEYELEERLGELEVSLIKDRDEFIFAVTENDGYVAMVLIERSGKTKINEAARTRLMALWQDAYVANLQKLIPLFAKQLNQGEIPINGVKNVATFKT